MITLIESLDRKMEEYNHPLPFITIIIPLFNTREYIIHCLESVACQTYQGPIECIIVDDYGTDGSVLLAEEFVRSYRGKIRFRIVHHTENLGLSEARNTGIKEANGNYIYFLDSDDSIIAECIEMLAGSLKKYPDAQIVFAGSEVIGHQANWYDYTQKKMPDYSNDHDWLQQSIIRGYFGIPAWNKLILRSFIEENNLSFVPGLVYEDEVWAFDYSNYIQSAAFVKHNTYIYIIRKNSLSHGVSDKLQWQRRFALWNVLLSRIDECNKEIKIRAITNSISGQTMKNFPVYYRKSLCELLHNFSRQSHGLLSLRLHAQGILALYFPSLYCLIGKTWQGVLFLFRRIKTQSVNLRKNG